MLLCIELSLFAFFIFKAQKTESSYKEEDFIQKKAIIEDKVFTLSLLKLNKESETFYQRDLEENLLFLSSNSRPDASLDEKIVLLGLKQGDLAQAVSLQEKTYLIYKQGVLHFSGEPTSLWIRIKEVQGDKMKYEGSLFLSSQERESVYQEKFVLEKNIESSVVSPILQEAPFVFFDEALAWPPDLLYEAYGGAEFEKAKGCYRLQFPSQDPQMCFVKKGSFLGFKEGVWSEIQEGQKMKGAYLAQIEELTPHKIEIKIWDETGLYCRHITLKIENLSSLSIRAEEVFCNLRQRASQLVSCKIGKQNSLLKKGDWLLKTSTHWKVLRTWDEVERYLRFDLNGELFVFEGIEKHEGNAVFKGALFDRMRTQMQQVKIPLHSFDKKGSKKKEEAAAQEALSSFSKRENASDSDELLKLTTPQKSNEFSK